MKIVKMIARFVGAIGECMLTIFLVLAVWDGRWMEATLIFLFLALLAFAGGFLGAMWTDLVEAKSNDDVRPNE